MDIKINGVLQQPQVVAHVSATTAPPWYDISGQIDYAMDHLSNSFQNHFGDWMSAHVWHPMLAGLCHFASVALPTLALAGVIWWMCSFLPWSDKGPKLIGTSLFLYTLFVMFGGLGV